MIKQYINGKSAGLTYAKMSTADFTTLQAVLAGRSEHYTVGVTGGTEFNTQTPNFKRISFGKKIGRKFKSSSVTFPHIKTSVTIDNIRPSVVGSWDVDFTLNEKADYCNLVGDSSKG